MTDRMFNPDDDLIDRLEFKEGIVPGLDLQLDAETETVGGDDVVDLSDDGDTPGLDLVPDPEGV